MEVLKIFLNGFETRTLIFLFEIGTIERFYIIMHICVYLYKKNSKVKTKSPFCSTYELKGFSKVNVNFFPTHVFFSQVDMVSEKTLEFHRA